MSSDNQEAAVNAMAAQVVYGDDDLRRDMKVFVMDALMELMRDGEAANLIASLAHHLHLPLGNAILINRAREIEKIVARYLTNKLSGDQY